MCSGRKSTTGTLLTQEGVSLLGLCSIFLLLDNTLPVVVLDGAYDVEVEVKYDLFCVSPYVIFYVFLTCRNMGQRCSILSFYDCKCLFWIFFFSFNFYITMIVTVSSNYSCFTGVLFFQLLDHVCRKLSNILWVLLILLKSKLLSWTKLIRCSAFMGEQ